MGFLTSFYLKVGKNYEISIFDLFVGNSPKLPSPQRIPSDTNATLWYVLRYTILPRC